jgi:hypothetical protein
LARFLDHTLTEEGPTLLPPVRPTPLEFRLFEAIGEPLPTAPLPLAYSVLDLSGDNGWRAQIEAAERLARVGSLPANRLLGLYTQRKAAASGGVWDRVRAFQEFERALEQRRSDKIRQSLMKIWPQMASARLLPQFAELYGRELSQARLRGRAAHHAQMARYLSPQYEDLSHSDPATGDEARFFKAIAQGQPPVPPLPRLPHAQAIAAGFGAKTIGAAAMPDILRDHLDQGRLGEAILRTVSLFSSGAEGNGQDLSDALASLRAMGLEDTARRAAMELVILDSERARR